MPSPTFSPRLPSWVDEGRYASLVRNFGREVADSLIRNAGKPSPYTMREAYDVARARGLSNNLKNEAA